MLRKVLNWKGVQEILCGIIHVNSLTLIGCYCMLTKGVNERVFMYINLSKDSILVTDFICPIGILLEWGCVYMRQNNRNPLQAMALMSAIVSQLVGSILIGIFSGRWLDRSLGTEPIFLIIGLLIGLAAGTYSMLLSIRHFYSGDK